MRDDAQTDLRVVVQRQVFDPAIGISLTICEDSIREELTEHGEAFVVEGHNQVSRIQESSSRRVRCGRRSDLRANGERAAFED